MVGSGGPHLKRARLGCWIALIDLVGGLQVIGLHVFAGKAVQADALVKNRVGLGVQIG